MHTLHRHWRGEHWALPPDGREGGPGPGRDGHPRSGQYLLPRANDAPYPRTLSGMTIGWLSFGLGGIDIGLLSFGPNYTLLAV